MRPILRFAHTGEVLGIPGHTLAGLVSLGAPFLVWTGLSLSLRRFSGWRGRRRPRPVARRERVEAEQPGPLVALVIRAAVEADLHFL